ncbi:hypothetical protein Oweho_0677 [Owenweeksia hongkongensis DSM 17368]|uniref:Uncharacterized protein n=1 Tax=Owenweeksia hongkongensis (strain DSM 17368 / CIP 108786 / JCM 12287 / NRRL B-23963 / UST20020801) TaxID=926562 RepID=G8R120_OWEHD|nr:hypothetical protein Oweho_0677 [Owenweeksia hongkongensis DSM 17368]
MNFIYRLGIIRCCLKDFFEKIIYCLTKQLLNNANLYSNLSPSIAEATFLVVTLNLIIPSFFQMQMG